MLFLFILLLSFLVLQGFILLDEEFLIILASFFWLDAAGSLIREGLTTEFEVKGTKIKDSYRYFLDLKKTTIIELLELHSKRKDLLSTVIDPLSNYAVATHLAGATKSYYEGVLITKTYVKKTDIKAGGSLVLDLMLKEGLVDRLREVEVIVKK